ncbi:DUF3147 family protein [Hydrogenovibrio kuenenii]|uniref:DUF3147 family protein n=1 Tax=Hydrogenovibrio kuenenii TaxID=63658 RepID=UPI00046382A8|nr:DUF3147 family protein [Hydrogenovibrio kuenenii]
MIYYVIKVVLTAILIVAIAETAKRSTLFGALIASLPVLSILAMFWLYYDTHDLQRISALSTQIIWLVIPSFIFFIALPILLKNGFHFYLSALISILMTSVGYLLMILLLKQIGIKI